MTEHTHTLSRRSFVTAGAVAAASASLLYANPMQAFAATAAQKQAEAQAALAKLDAVNDKLHQAENSFELASYEQELAKMAMDEAQDKIDNASSRILTLQDHLGTRARGMYRNGSFTFLDVLLSATSFQTFTTNWGLLNEMNEADAAMVAETKVLRSEVEQQKAVFAEQERQAAAKAAEAERVKNEAAALQQEMQATYNSLSAEAASLVKAEQEARERAAAAQAAQARPQQPPTTSDNKPIQGNTSSGDNLPVLGGSDAISRAQSAMGVPYVLGGGGPSTFDCSGFVSWCLTGKYGRQLGTTYTMAKYPIVSNPQPGDMAWWWEHVGLYIGGGRMIHASFSAGKVVNDAVSNIERGKMGKVTYRRFK